MNVWTVANQKGGVGKTTTAVTLGGLLAAEGRRTLLIDLDPHGSLTSYFGLDPDTVEPSVYTLFARTAGSTHVPLAAILQRTRFDNLFLVPASSALVSLDRQFGAREGMGLIVAQALRTWGGQFEYVLIDCPPTLGILMVNALASCDRVVVPVQTDFLAIKGLERLLHTLAMIEKSRPGGLRTTIVPTMYDRRTRSADEGLGYLRSHYGDRLWSGVIPVDTRFREASQRGAPLSHIAPREERGVQAYAALLANLRAAEAAPLAQSEAV